MSGPVSGPGTVVWVNGALADPRTASLHWSDHAITVGDGVFETVKLRDGQTFALTRHLDRLDRSAAALGLVLPDPSEIRSAITAVVQRFGREPGRLRVTVTGGPGPMGSARGDDGPTLLVTAGTLAVDRSPTDVIMSPWTRNERGALCGVKSISYGENVVALARAAAHGATEALFANTLGQLCEGTGSNVFVGLDGHLVTPPLSSGCLAGVTRALLLEALAGAGAPAGEIDIAVEDLVAADELLLVSTIRDVQAVRHIDGRALPRCPGPLTERATAVWDGAYGPGTPVDP